MEIYRAGEKWSLMELVARELWKRHQDQPVYWNDLAWAVRRSEGLHKACQIHLEAVKNFTEDAMTNYNLGHYHCQLGELEQAIKLDGEFKILTLDDSDLEPQWKEWEI
jgi:hypothetical protein